MGAEAAMIVPFALLLLGHALGDFVFQSDELVRRKRDRATRAGALAQHALIVLVCHAVAALPLLSPRGALWLLGLVLAHAITDALKLLWDDRTDRRLVGFLADQVVHLALAAVVAAAWDREPLPFAQLSAAPWLAFTPAALVAIAHASLFASAWIYAWRAGAIAVALVLAGCRIPTEETKIDGDGTRLGRVIGVLERLLITTLVLHDAWAGIGLILAAKSIARFKELETNRRFGEYYLVGTLASVLIAVVVGLGIARLLRALALA